MLSSTYHFWGVHNLYHTKSANSILESKAKLVGFFLFSFFVFRFSFFVIRFSIFDFVIRFSLFFFRFSLFVFCYSKSGPVSYFDIGTEANFSIFIFKILFDIRTGAE